MYKKEIRPILLSSFALILLSSSVFAANRFTETLAMIGKFFFEDIPSMGPYGFKFLIWIVLFALIHMGLKRAGDFFKNRTAGIISFVLSLATVILMPNKAVILIFGLYANIVIIALGLIVPLILFWAIHSGFEGEDSWSALIRSVLYFLCAASLFWFVANAKYLLVTNIGGVV